jgi:hypothetical protein
MLISFGLPIHLDVTKQAVNIEYHSMLATSTSANVRLISKMSGVQTLLHLYEENHNGRRLS